MQMLKFHKKIFTLWNQSLHFEFFISYLFWIFFFFLSDGVKILRRPLPFLDSDSFVQAKRKTVVLKKNSLHLSFSSGQKPPFILSKAMWFRYSTHLFNGLSNLTSQWTLLWNFLSVYQPVLLNTLMFMWFPSQFGSLISARELESKALFWLWSWASV